MKNLLERIAQGDVLISDGAMGTFLHAKGLAAGECPESWCMSHPDVVRGIAEAYIEAGSDVVETNSFGGSSFKLKPYGAAGRVAEFNRAAAALAKQAMGGRGFVAASVGPTGHILEDEGGDTTAEQLYEAFKQQIVALAEGGADAICVETMSSLEEAKQAIRAAKENTKLPVICTFTFEAGAKGFRTMMGLKPDRAAREAVAAGADIVGANCGNGIGNMIEIAQTVVEGALQRKESRGSHFMVEYPKRDDANFLAHTLAYRSDGAPRMSRSPVAITKWQPMERKY